MQDHRKIQSPIFASILGGAEEGRRQVPKALSGEEVRQTKFQLFEDKAGEFRWRLRANNGEIIADSNEGYVNKRDAMHGIDLVKEVNPETSVEDLTTE